MLRLATFCVVLPLVASVRKRRTQAACASCSECIAVPGNGAGGTDQNCAPCANSGQSWWPCNVDGLCQCAGGPGPTPIPSPSPFPPTPTPPSPPPFPPSWLIPKIIEDLEASNSDGVFMYDTGRGWLPSDIYTWADMIIAVREMATRGVGRLTLWVGDFNHHEGLVNIAAFLAQCMQETIQYNACDENNWSDKATVHEVGGTEYSSASACGQMAQSYQDYKCSAEEDALAGGQMACDVDPNMEMRAVTQAGWFGAPPKMFCAPKSKVPKTPRWNYGGPWCNPKDEKFPPNVSLDTYFEYVNSAGSCKDYPGQKAGGWTFSGCGADGCQGSAAPLFGKPEGRTDVEGCCWWGRGVIQTTGTCNYGKLNYYLGKRAADEGRDSLFPAIDFCKDPQIICKPESPPELKWIAGFFYWLNFVQDYDHPDWNYKGELKRWVRMGFPTTENSFIDGASGLVNRGCHNPPNCGTGDLHGGPARRENFKKVLKAMRLI